MHSTTIQIIKTKDDKRHVKFVGMAFDEFDTLDEAKEYVKGMRHGEEVEVRGVDLIETYTKNS